MSILNSSVVPAVGTFEIGGARVLRAVPLGEATPSDRAEGREASGEPSVGASSSGGVRYPQARCLFHYLRAIRVRAYCRGQLRWPG
jgi:hypothetical protein